MSFTHPMSRLTVSLRGLPDLLAARDPGFAATRAGLLAATGIGIAAMLGAPLAWAARSAGAVPPATTTLALVSGVVALMSAMSIGDRTMAGQTRTAIAALVAFVAAMAGGLVVAVLVPAPVLDVGTVVLSGLAVLVRHRGPRWTAAGGGAFNGWFVALMLGGGLTAGEVGWLMVAAVVGTLTYLAVRATILPVGPARQARRFRRTWRARARRLLLLAADALTESLSEAGEAGARASLGRRRRQVVELTETTLMLDAAYAGLDDAAPRTRALFEAESALAESARLAGELAMEPAGSELRLAARAALLAAAEDPTGPKAAAATAALMASDDDAGRPAADARTAARLAETLRWYAKVSDLTAGVAPAPGRTNGDAQERFVPAAVLQGDFLVSGARPHTATATRRTADGADAPRDRFGLTLVSRQALQTVGAMGVAMLLGYAVLGHAPTWGMLTIFYALMAGMNAADHVRRGLHRLAGTAAGVALGAAVASLLGDGGVAAIAVTVPAIFVGVALIRVRYLVMPTATATVLAQFEHVVTGSVPWDVLGLRLTETLIGVLGIALAVLVVLPVRPRRVLTTAREQWVAAQTAAVEAVMGVEAGRLGAERMAVAVRDADLAYLALRSVLGSAETTRPDLSWRRFVDDAARIRLHTRVLASYVAPPEATDGPAAAEIETLLTRLRHDVAAARTADDENDDLAPLRAALA